MANQVRVDAAAVARFGSDRNLMRDLEDSGLLNEIVAEMRRLAPRNSGEGADSIDWEIDESGEFFRIAWGKDHFYMYFHEVGTVHLAARPFMRPVADQYNSRR